MHTSQGAVLARIAASALVLVGLTACSASVSVGGTPKVAAEDVAQQISDSLAESVGRAPDEVECPEALTGTIDAEVRCVLTDGDVRYGVTATVTSVEGTKVDFSVLVDDEPLADQEQ